MSICERLLEAREARGFTQKQVADQMGISKSTYCGYETGKRQPDVLKLKHLSKILGVSGDFLLETGYEEKPLATNENDYTKYFTLSSSEFQLIQKFRSLDDTAKGRILNALDYEYASLPGNMLKAAPKEA